jgi:hypothetical protein
MYFESLITEITHKQQLHETLSQIIDLVEPNQMQLPIKPTLSQCGAMETGTACI